MPTRDLVKHIVCYFFVCLLLSTNSAAKDLQIVTEEFPPYSYTLNNEVVGKSTELVKLVLKKLNLEKNINVLPWGRAYNSALHNPNTLIYSLAKNSQREHLFHWVGILSTVDVCLFSLNERKLGAITSLEQMKNYRVVSQREGHISQQLIKSGFKERKNLFNAVSIEHAIQMLMLNRADFIGYPAEVLFYTVEQGIGNHQELIRTNFCIDSTALYLAFSKSTPVELVDKFRHALEEVKQDINWAPSSIHTVDNSDRQ